MRLSSRADAAAFLLLLLTAVPAGASVQKPMYCWSPDSEFPILCEEEEDDPEGSASPGPHAVAVMRGALNSRALPEPARFFPADAS